MPRTVARGEWRAARGPACGVAVADRMTDEPPASRGRNWACCERMSSCGWALTEQAVVRPRADRGVVESD